MGLSNRTAITLCALLAGCIAAVVLAVILGRVIPSDPNLGVCLVVGGGVVVSLVTSRLLVRVRARN